MESSSPATALLVLDMQVAVISRLPDYQTITTRVAQAIVAARAQGLPVLFVVVGFRPGMPEVSADNKLFAGSKARAVPGMEALMRIDEAVAPRPDDLVITKRRVSAFSGSDLEVVLRAQGIRHLVLCGVATSGVVLSTFCEAADRDYRLTVLADCCTDASPEAHAALLQHVFPRQGTVTTLAEWPAAQGTVCAG